MALELPPVDDTKFDLHANQGPRLIGTSVILLILPTIFVALRLVSRKLSKAGFWVIRFSSLRRS